MLFRFVSVAAIACASFACKRSEDGGTAASSAKPVTSAREAATLPHVRPPAARCRSGGASYTVGEPGPRGGAEPDEAPIGEPFAIEIGSAVAHGGGFAVGALELRGDKSHAIVALLSEKGTGRLLELGRVHGNVEPPRLAARDGKLITVVPDSDASGTTLRVAVVRQLAGKDDIVWGVEATEGRDESQVFDVELGARRALVVWDEYDKRDARGLVRALSVDGGDPSNATLPRTLSADNEDAEAPRLAPREGGFWIAWLSREYARGQKRSRPARRPADGGDPASVLELGRRVLRVARLDDAGSVVAEPLTASSADSHVLVFDLARAANGELLLAWRDDATVVGAEAFAVKLARVGADGAVERLVVQDDDIGAGAPVLLVDSSAKSPAGHAWLALSGLSDATRLGALGAGLTLTHELVPEPAIGTAEPLLLDAERLLLARPRGLAVELETVRCGFGRQDAKATDKPTSSTR